MSPLHRKVLLNEAWKVNGPVVTLATFEPPPPPRSPRLYDSLERDPEDSTQEESEVDSDFTTMHKPIKPLMPPPPRPLERSPNPTEHGPSSDETGEGDKKKEGRKDSKGDDEDFIMELEEGFHSGIGGSSASSSKSKKTVSRHGIIDWDMDVETSDNDSTSSDPKTYKELLDSDSRIWMWCGTDHGRLIRDMFDLEFRQQPLVNPVVDTNPQSINELQLRDFIRVVFISEFFRDGVHFAMYVLGKYNSVKMMGACFSGRPYDGPFFATPIILHALDELLPMRRVDNFEEILRGETKGLRFKYYYETCLHAWERLDYDAARAAALSLKYPSSPVEERTEGQNEGEGNTLLESPESPPEVAEGTEDMRDYEAEEGGDADVPMDMGDDESE
ncbi:hypothetical protein BDV96DRAFT_605117 [Lophiotrema nucula]|uniref:Uncharacterized protein n=1 Tax=Lophiotrema nucula TaxID=690887 RepID=A0A6A5YP61_9PLEO|nr:hypothetical protein BDV96DRAFT_605117 [Lophiotrema nucula]